MLEPRHPQAVIHGDDTVGIAALTFARVIEIPIQAQHLPHLHQPLLQPHRHHIPIQLRTRRPLPLPLLLVLILRIRQSRRLPRTGPRRLRRPRAPQRALKVGCRGSGGSSVRERRRHLVHFRRPAAAAAGEFVETGDEGGGIKGAGCRDGVLTERPRALLLVVGRRWAVDDAAAEVAAVVVEGGARLISIRVPGTDGQGAVVVVGVIGVVVRGEVAAGHVDA